jgi:hypothetical protein
MSSRCKKALKFSLCFRTWLLTGELYLKLGMVEAAEQCCTEARLLYPLSYLILFLKGEIHQVGHIF